MLDRRPLVLVELVHHGHKDRLRPAVAELYRTRYSARLRAYQSVDLPQSSKARFNARLCFLLRRFRAGSTEAKYARDGISILLVPARGRRLNKRGEKSFPSSLAELEDFSIEGILIGDLIYDLYCKHHRLASPDIESQNFRNYFLESVAIFDYWMRYFDRRNVIAVLGSAVYRQGIVARIAIHRGVKVLTGDDTILESLSRENFYSTRIWRFYPELFRALGPSERAKGTADAASQFEKLLSGRSSKLPYPGYEVGNSFQSEKLSIPRVALGSRGIVILTHDVFDSTHVWGKNFHTDYFQWLKAVCELSREVEAEWFVKNHPVEPPEATSIVSRLLESYPHITLLPPSTNPHEMKRAGIDIGLTVNGTVAAEYPKLGISIINCSDNTPHRRYSFSSHPASIVEYESLLRGLPPPQPVNLTEVLEYRFMRWSFPRYSFLSSPENNQSHPSRVPSRKKWSRLEEQEIEVLDQFVQSNAVCLVERFMVFHESDGSVRVDTLRSLQDG